MRYYKELIITILIGVALWLWWDGQKAKTDYMAKERHLKAIYDTLQNEWLEATKETLRLTVAYNDAKRALQAQSIETARYKVKYEQAKNRPITRYSDHAIDSILSVLYPR